MKCHNCGRAIVAKGWKRSWVEVGGFVYCARAGCNREAMVHEDMWENREGPV